MFQNAFQQQCLEIFDAKDVLNKANKEKYSHYQQLYKVSSMHFAKNFDKVMKNYIFDLEGHNTKMQFPVQGSLGLVSQYLVLQIYIPQTQQWTIEFTLTDTTNTKRHVYLSQNTKTIEKKPFHIKYPYDVPKGEWLNLQIDLYSFMQGWKGQTFRSLDLLILQSPCRLRKIFTSRVRDDDGSQTSKAVEFPIGTERQYVVVQYVDPENSAEMKQEIIQVRVTSKKATGFSNQSQQQPKQPQQKITQEKITRNIVYNDDHPTPKKKALGTPISKKNLIQSNDLDLSGKQFQRYDVANSAKKEQLIQRPTRSVPRQQQQFNKIPKQQQKKQEEYYLQTQKFSTINEPLKHKEEDQIEENIDVVDTQTKRVEDLIHESQQKTVTANNFNKRSLSELRNDSKVEVYDDSLEQQQGFFAAELKKYTELQRPFTPEYSIVFQFLKKQQ